MSVFEMVLLLAAIAFLAYIGHFVFTKAGRGKMLGGEIVWSGKKHQLQPKGSFSGHREHLQVHALKVGSVGGAQRVGLELRSRSLMHITTTPISLTVEQALELSDEIRNAANGHST